MPRHGKRYIFDDDTKYSFTELQETEGCTAALQCFESTRIINKKKNRNLILGLIMHVGQGRVNLVKPHGRCRISRLARFSVNISTRLNTRIKLFKKNGRGSSLVG